MSHPEVPLHTLYTQPVFIAYAASVIVLVVTLYGLGFYTAKVRADRKLVLNAEDASINGGARLVDTEHADVLRIKRAHLNLLENATPFFAIGWLYTLTEPGLSVAVGLFGTFVVIRVLHAIFYLSAIQPFRTASFAVGALINLAMAVQVFRALLG